MQTRFLKTLPEGDCCQLFKNLEEFNYDIYIFTKFLNSILLGFSLICNRVES